jgi:4-diphosphocytidyl-2-C-methyl-D-erythritol kinase
MHRLVVAAPAKINLALHVLGRRADGYHELDSIFLPLALADELRLACTDSERAEVRCSCPGHAALEGPDNLASRAALAYLEAAGLAQHVEVELHKQIWITAGLGGGSSDAGAVLRALDRRFGRLAPARLLELARQLGADVPFFLDPRPARARGIGDRLTPLILGPGAPRHVALANPGVPLRTAGVYAALGIEPGTSTGAPPLELPDDHILAAATIPAVVRNDLEPAATRLLPAIAELKRALLRQGAACAAMSGSGPTVFGLFGSADEASRAAVAIRASPIAPSIRALATEVAPC